MLVNFLLKKGISAAILDAAAENLTFIETAKQCVAAKARLIALVIYGQQPSASTLVMPGAGATAKAIKELQPELPVLMVGGHVAALPERTLREEKVDYVCDGEGPYTLFELIKALRESVPNVSKVHGLVYMDSNGQIIHTPSAPLVRDLDQEMPGVAWDLLPMKKYKAHNWHCFGKLDKRIPYASIYTSLGCPFRCDFCCINAPFERGYRNTFNNAPRYRMWNSDTVLNQIDDLVLQYGVSNIKFADELFVFNENHVIDICKKLQDRNYNLNIWAYVRIDTWNKKILEHMYAAGIRWLAPGIESGNDRVRRNIHKAFGEDAIEDSITMFKKWGFYVIGNFLLGLPDDSFETMQQTVDFAKKLNCEFINLYCAMAYPGSKLYEKAIRENIDLPDSWSAYSQHSYDTSPLSTKFVSGADVLRFRDAAFYEYFTNPIYLEMIQRTFDEDAVAHLKCMVAQKLSRKLLA
jgi:radical SAM superfamily enzyme YgiQ (UPF0313 family)